MANPFLADIQGFSKARLKKVQTKVITADGQKLIETKDAKGNIITMNEDGTVVPSQSAPPDKITAHKPKVDENAAKLANGDDAGGDADSEKAKDAIKSGINRGRLDRQASIDAMKSSVSLKNRLAAFSVGPDEDSKATEDAPKKPSRLSPSKFDNISKEDDDKSAPPSPTLKSAAISEARNKFLKQERVAEEETASKPLPPSPKKQWSPPPKSSQPSDAHVSRGSVAEEVEEDAITKRLGGTSKQCTEVLPGIYMGYRDLKERLPDVSEFGITHILNFLPRLVLDNTSQKEFIYKKIDIPDNPTTDIRQYFSECFDFIEKALAYKTPDGHKGRILLFCTQNEHISSCIMIGYLIKTQNKTYKEAHDFLLGKRANIKPGENFSRRLKHYEHDLVDEDELFGNIEDEDLEALAKELDSDESDDDSARRVRKKSAVSPRSGSPSKSTPASSKASSPAKSVSSLGSTNKQTTPAHSKTAVSPTKLAPPPPKPKPQPPPPPPAPTSSSSHPSNKPGPTPLKSSTPQLSSSKPAPAKPAATPSTPKSETSKTTGTHPTVVATKPADKASKLAKLGGYKPNWG